jgi:hypothetical protein
MSNLIQNTKKAAMAVAAVATLATGVTVASSGTAEAQWRGRYVGGPAYRGGRGYGYGYGYRRGGRGAGVAAGIIGGLAAGALIAGATNSYAYGAPAYGYGYAPSYGYAPAYSYGYAPAYYGGGYAYAAPTCYTRRVREVDDWGRVLVRRVRICD